MNFDYISGNAALWLVAFVVLVIWLGARNQ